MEILSLIQNRTGFHRQSVRTWEGPCPKCGGTKRCIVWIHTNIFKCRECDFKGGIIQWLKAVEGLGCKEAHDHAGIICDNTGCPSFEKCSGAPRKRTSSRAPVSAPADRQTDTTPAPARTPAEIWKERAEKLTADCHQRLLAQYDETGNPTVNSSASWLAARGIPMAAVVKHRLGWLAGENGKNCFYRPRAPWGLPEKLKDGKPVKLWIPRGITIPTIISGRIDRIRIRRPNEDLQPVDGKEPLKYLAIEGGGTAVVSLNPAALAQMPIESDLDAILIDHQAGDLVGAIPLTTCGVMPNGDTARICREAVIVLVSLDFDAAKVNPATGREERAGEKAWRNKWQPTYPNAVRWPVPAGKDPGEAFARGVDLRAWVLAGLPVSLHPAKPTSPAVAESLEQTAIRGVSPVADAYSLVHIVTAADGRQLHVTDDPEEYRRLSTEGRIVFNGQELAIIRKSGLDKQQAAKLIDLKATFGTVFTAATIGGLIFEEQEASWPKPSSEGGGPKTDNVLRLCALSATADGYIS